MESSVKMVFLWKDQPKMRRVSLPCLISAYRIYDYRRIMTMVVHMM